MNNNNATMNTCSEIGFSNISTTQYITDTPYISDISAKPYNGVANISTTSWRPVGPTIRTESMPKATVNKSRDVGYGLADLVNDL